MGLLKNPLVGTTDVFRGAKRASTGNLARAAFGRSSYDDFFNSPTVTYFLTRGANRPVRSILICKASI